MPEYTQGITSNGPVTLKDGEPMSVDEIVKELTYYSIEEKVLNNAVIDMAFSQQSRSKE